MIQGRVGVGVYRVTFADEQGNPRAEITLHAGQMLLLVDYPDNSRQTA